MYIFGTINVSANCRNDVIGRLEAMNVSIDSITKTHISTLFFIHVLFRIKDYAIIMHEMLEMMEHEMIEMVTITIDGK